MRRRALRARWQEFARRDEAGARSLPRPLPEEAPEIPQHFVGIPADAEVLDAEVPALVHERRQEGVVHVSSRRLRTEDAVSSGDLPDLALCPREERPSGGLGAVSASIAPEDLRRIALRVHRDRDEDHPAAELVTETVLEAGHLRGEQRTGIHARRVDEGDR